MRLALTKFVNQSGERRVAVDTEGAASHTIFNLKERLGGFSLLEAELKTGRTHQIRVHLAHLGFPIVGDDKYGDFELNRRVASGEFGPRFGRMFLHACTTQPGPSHQWGVAGADRTAAAGLQRLPAFAESEGSCQSTV